MITPKIKQAIEFATQRHETSPDPYRKGKQVPYIVHPLDVMNILLKEENLSESLIIAGICHDLVEDTNTTLDEIRDLFGEEVANFVNSDSEPDDLKNDPDKKGTWKKRKEDTINRVSNGNKYEKMLACADKLANLTDIDSDLKVGINIWDRMNASKDEQKWYYESMLESFTIGDSIEGSRMFKLLKSKIEEVFK